MPISVLCPSCSAPVTAPDSAAGKRAKCPKCQEAMILPGGEADFEVVEDAAPKSKPRVRVDDDDKPTRKSRRRDEEDDEEDERPKKKSSRRAVVAEDDDDDEDERPARKSRRRKEDDDEDERPRKKGKSKTKAGPPMGLVIGGGLALLLLVAGGLYFAFSGSKGSGTTAPVAAAPKGINWVPFDAPDGSFSTAYPEGAPTAEGFEALARQSGEANLTPEKIEEAKKGMEALGISMTGWSRSHGQRKYLVLVVGVPPALAKQMTPDAIMKQGRQQNPDKVLAETNFSTGGLQGKEILSRDERRGQWQMIRFATATSGKIVVLLVESKDELKAADPDAQAFFGKFQWKMM